MPTTTLSIDYRPLRVGFLVRQGNVDDFIAAAELNTALWGGIYNPILPVGGDAKLFDYLFAAFSPDLLHPVANDVSLNDAFKRYPHLSWPRTAHTPDLIKHDKVLACVDILPLLAYYWEKTYKFKQESHTFVPIWDPADPLNVLLTAIFGRFPSKETLKIDYADNLKRGIYAEEVKIEKDAIVPAALLKKTPPIAFTGRRLRGRSSSWSHDGVYLGALSDFDDLVNFWNLRAAGMALQFVAKAGAERVDQYLKAWAAALWDEVTKSPDEPKHFAIWSKDREVDDRRLSEVLPADVKQLRCHVDTFTWNGFNVRPARHSIESERFLAAIDRREGSAPSITFSLAKKPLPEQLPRPCESQLWGVDVESWSDNGYEGYTLHPPFLPELNETMGRDLTFEPHGLRIGPEKITLIEDLHKEHIHLHPVERNRLWAEILKVAGLESEMSQPGRIAERLIFQMRDLEGTRVFKIPGVRKLVESRDARNGVTRGHATQMIFDKADDGSNSFERHKRLFIEQREHRDLTTNDVFDFLVKKAILLPGLSLKCPNCTLEYWVPINAIRHNSECEYCGHRHLVALQIKDRGDWRFRLSGLFGREDHQQGAIAVLLALRQLGHLLHHGNESFLYSTALKLKGGGVNCEADLLALEQDPGGEIRIAVGECKTNGDITDDDIQRLLAVRGALEKLGMTCFLLFAKTAARFSDEEIARFKGASGQGVPLILFTARELDPYEVYEGEDWDRLPQKHAMNFREAAENSAFRYLRAAAAESSPAPQPA